MWNITDDPTITLKPLLTVRIHGKPQPAGSKRGFVIKGRAVLTDANKNSKPWQSMVKAAALDAIPDNWELVEGPVVMWLTFGRVRPKSHYNAKGELNKKGREALFPTTKPDSTKLVRGVEDALTKLVWYDDAQVIDQHARKIWDSTEYCEVRIDEVLHA